ncbi:hypothetical protein [Helicobacter sp. T3_23-1056]
MTTNTKKTSIASKSSTKSSMAKSSATKPRTLQARNTTNTASKSSVKSSASNGANNSKRNGATNGANNGATRLNEAKSKDSKTSSLSLKTLQVAELFTSVESKREFAKLGMSASLLVCVGSAFFKGNFARNLHIASGVALVGFSIWHHSLYEKK